MKIKVENKVTVLSDTLKEFFSDKMNLARIKFFSLFISALCKVQTVCFEKLAYGFDSSVKAESSLRRIQRFQISKNRSFTLKAIIKPLFKQCKFVV
jgi:hypothetical protein